MYGLKALKAFGYLTGAFLWIVLLVVLLVSGTGLAQENLPFISLIQTFEPEKTSLSNPSGLAFSSRSNKFYVVESKVVAEDVNIDDTVIKSISVIGQDVGTTQINLDMENPINLAMDNHYGRLLIYQFTTGQFIEIKENHVGKLDPSTQKAYLTNYKLNDPQGMTIDPSNGSIYFLDAVGPRLVHIILQSDASFINASIDSVSLLWARNLNLRGIALDPWSGNLQTICTGNHKLYEFSLRGDLVATRELTEYNISNPQGIIFAPSGDQTDSPSIFTLYIADDGYLPVSPTKRILRDAKVIESSEGTILEFSLIRPVQQQSVLSFNSTLVKTTNMAAYSQPSPDPSGLTFLSTRNTLLMSDGEVEETVNGITHFMGANIWEINLDGSVVRTANISKVSPTVVRMTNEPTDVTWNPSNGHFYYSDDDALKVFDLNPGNDGLVGTVDDSWTSFSTSSSGDGDPEGIAYDGLHNRLFVVDGNNREVYQYSLSGTLVNHFDTLVYGVVDPEGVEFNPINGTLFILGNYTNRIIVETTTSGNLIQTSDVSASSSSAPAGLAFAPASDGSGAWHFYIVDRGIDNDVDPYIIDGKMYEMTAPVHTAGNTPPVINAGLDQTVSIDNSVSLNGSASDDGLPNPPAIMTFQWSMVGGPGNVTFIDPNSLSTTASFSCAGTYFLRLTAGDSEFFPYDEVTVTVTGTGTSIIIDSKVTVGSDDAEEWASGYVDLNNADLELVEDATIQTVGIRFREVTIPKNAQITYAYIQFQVDELSSIITSLIIWGEAKDNPGTFTSSNKNVSSRVKTSSFVNWSPPPWILEGQASVDQRTPNLQNIIQEIVNRPGWTPGNAMVFVINGTGKRIAESYNGLQAGAPSLHIEYLISNNNTPTPTRTNTPTNTAPMTPSSTPSVTPSPTDTLISTPTQTASFTTSPTNTSTSTPTETAPQTPSPTNTSTLTPTQNVTETPSPTSSSIPVPSPTETLTPAPTATSTPGMFITVPQNLIINPGTLREDFETLNGWTVSGTGSGYSFELDNINKKDGAASIKLITPPSGSVYITKSVAWDLSADQGNFRFWVYVSGSSTPTAGKICLYSDTKMTNYFCAPYGSVFTFRYRPGWNLINIRTSDWTMVGSPNWASIVRLRISLNSNSVNTYSFDSLTSGLVAQPAVIFTFDNGLASLYSQAFSYMQTRNVRGTGYIPTSLVGGANNITWGQLLEMNNASWTIGNQTNTNVNLTTIDYAGQLKELQDARATLNANSILNADYVAYPVGQYNTDTLLAMASLNMRTGRTLLIFNNVSPLASPYEIAQRSISKSTSLSQVQGWVNTAIARQEILVFTINGLSNNPASSDWYISSFQSLVSYCISNSVPFITMDDLYQLQSSSIIIPYPKQ